MSLKDAGRSTLLGGVVVLAVALQGAVILGSGPQEGRVVRIDRSTITVRPLNGPDRTFPVDRGTLTTCKRLPRPRWHQSPGWPVGDGKGSCWTPRQENR